MRRTLASIEVLCIGHAAYDLSLYLENFPKEDSKSETDEMSECGGGPAANAACLLSSWGIPCAFAGLLGEDTYGHRILAEFVERDIDVSLVEARPGHSTPLSIVLVSRANGSRTLINRKAPGATLELSSKTLAGMHPRILHFDGHELSASLLALQQFPDAISVLDAGSLREGTEVLAGKVDYLVSSEKFARQRCRMRSLDSGRARREAIRCLKKRYGNVIVVTLGDRGLIAHDREGYLELPAFKAKTVDTTGAGDIFHGAFVYALAKRMGFKETLRLASMAACLSVERKGGRSSIPSLAEVTSRLENY